MFFSPCFWIIFLRFFSDPFEWEDACLFIGKNQIQNTNLKSKYSLENRELLLQIKSTSLFSDFGAVGIISTTSFEIV
uniref:Putative ovule protein n=1 Tax=Solanum chacoense TaxID=4108 RepID=A0A0V0GW63_SOLCH